MKCFRCNHSGLLLPPDYLKMWGILYGHGLGKEPVSECLDTDYGKLPLAEEGRKVRYKAGPGDLMYPLSDSRANVMLVDVPEADYNKPENRLVLVKDDRDFSRRIKIVRAKQKKRKPEWNRLKSGVGAVD